MKALIIEDFTEFIIEYGFRGILLGIGIVLIYIAILWCVKKFHNPQMKIRASLFIVIWFWR